MQLLVLLPKNVVDVKLPPEKNWDIAGLLLHVMLLKPAKDAIPQAEKSEVIIILLQLVQLQKLVNIAKPPRAKPWDIIGKMLPAQNPKPVIDVKPKQVLLPGTKDPLALVQPLPSVQYVKQL